MSGINPLPKRLPDEKTEELARKRTGRLREQAGVFADYAKPVTAEQVTAEQVTAEQVTAEQVTAEQVQAGEFVHY